MTTPLFILDMDGGTAEPASTGGAIVVGVDFGVTFSGVSYSTPGGSIYQVTNWPGGDGDEKTEAKAPSKIRYTNNGDILWGYEVDGDDALTFEWFKIAIKPQDGMFPCQQASAKLDILRSRLNISGKTAVGVTSDFLSKLWNHVVNEMRVKIGQTTIDSTSIHVTFAVPDGWGQDERQALREATLSNILKTRPGVSTTHEFLPDSMAAITAVQQDLNQRLGPDSMFMIADLGGVFARMVCYRNSGDGNSYSQLEKVAPEASTQAGGAFLDEAFEKYAAGVLPAHLRNLKSHDPRAWRRFLLTSWHGFIKRYFTWTGNGKVWVVDLPNGYGQLRMHEDEIRDVFESSVMPEIMRLAEHQTNEVKRLNHGSGPSLVVPVGGLGLCRYVVENMSRAIQE